MDGQCEESPEKKSLIWTSIVGQKNGTKIVGKPTIGVAKYKIKAKSKRILCKMQTHRGKMIPVNLVEKYFNVNMV